MAGVAPTVAIALALWGHSPIVALPVLAAVYAIAAVFLYANGPGYNGIGRHFLARLNN